jgi:hypothetical protein
LAWLSGFSRAKLARLAVQPCHIGVAGDFSRASLARLGWVSRASLACLSQPCRCGVAGELGCEVKDVGLVLAAVVDLE